MSLRRPAFYLSLLLAIGTTGTARANPPDAGSLLNEQRQQGSTLPSRLPKPDDGIAERATLTESGVKVTVKTITFSGATQLATDAELQALVSGSIGKQLSFAELQTLADKVTAYLRDIKGYLLARAYLPKQDVTEGSIEIAILSGKLEQEIKINIKQPARIRQSVLAGIAGNAMDQTGAVRTNQIERAAILMNDLPGVTVKASLEPGSAPDTTRLILDASEGNLFGGALYLDNHGDRNTGDLRATGQLAVYDPSGFGDQITLAVTGAEGSIQGRAGYSIPLGSSGLNLQLNWSTMYYKLGKEFASLDLNGNSNTTGIGLTYPLMRSRTTSIWSGLNFEYLYLEDKTGSTTYRKRNIPVANTDLTANLYDTWLGGGMSNLRAALYYGSLDVKNSDPTIRTNNGGFFRATYSLSRLQRVVEQLTVFASLRGQFAGSKLDSSQKFILGGPGGVRAYPVGEASGDEGHAATLEARYELPFMPKWFSTQLVGFVDTGWIKLNHSGGTVNTATGKNDYQISGIGTGFNIAGNGIYTMQAYYAHSLGDNPGRNVNGTNADNRGASDRVWLQATVRF